MAECTDALVAVFPPPSSDHCEIHAAKMSRNNGSTSNGSRSSSVISNLCKFQSKPNYSSFPTLPECIIWIRILLGTLYGISLGLRDQIGFPAIIFGLNVVTFLPVVYVNTYLGANAESYSKQGLNFVGVPNGMATMLLVWIVIFTQQHSEEEKAFSAALLNKVSDVILDNPVEEKGIDAAATGSDDIQAEDTEF